MDKNLKNIPLISMILCNTSREREPLNFLKSIEGSTSKVELIIVFQPKVNLTILKYLKANELNFFSIKILEAPLISLSYARNIGLKYATGLNLCFPDDDCFYSKNLLNELILILEDIKYEKHCIGVAIHYPGSKIKKLKGKITYQNLLGNIISYSFFLKNPANFKEIEFFNEKLGVGCFFGSAEESEYLLRLLKKKNYIKPIKDLKVFHPINDLESYRREFSYGKGHGALAAIYLINYPLFGSFVFLKILFFPFLKIIIYIFKLNLKKALLVITTIIGRLIGFICYLLFTIWEFICINAKSFA